MAEDRQDIERDVERDDLAADTQKPNASLPEDARADSPDVTDADLGDAPADPKEAEVAEEKNLGGVRIRLLNTVMIVLAAVVSLAFLQAVQQTSECYNELDYASDTYIECASAAADMKDGSNYLTTQLRNFVAIQDPQYVENFFEELLVTQRRDHAVGTLERLMGDSDAYAYIKTARSYANELEADELYAAKLVVEANNLEVSDKVKAVLDKVDLSAEDEALSPEGKSARAVSLVFSETYLDNVYAMTENISLCRAELVQDLQDRQAEGSAEMHDLLFRQQLLTWILLLVSIGIVLLVIFVVLWPLQNYTLRVRKNEPLPMRGAHELRYLAGAYNVMYEENLRNHDQLRRKAEHDHLTGLYNRSVFEKLLYAYREEPIALLLIDADYFKSVNDTLGHDGGDAMLQKIAHSLTETFRSTDYPCRIGGDEFAVIMTEMNPGLKDVVEARIHAVTDYLKDTSDGLPEMTLSIGVAFSGNTGMDAETLFKNADNVLYEVKEAGRNDYRFHK